MKLKTFLEGIKLAVAHIENWEELEVISSSDDEGNFYSKVYFEPTIGFFDTEDNEFYSEGTEGWDGEEPESNSICIN
jgi:hypothetical protein